VLLPPAPLDDEAEDDIEEAEDDPLDHGFVLEGVEDGIFCFGYCH